MVHLQHPSGCGMAAWDWACGVLALGDSMELAVVMETGQLGRRRLSSAN